MQRRQKTETKNARIHLRIREPVKTQESVFKCTYL